MFILTYKINSTELDSKIEILQINDIYNFFYENPLEITTDNYGYGYIEKDNEIIDLKVAFDGDDSLLEDFKNTIELLISCSIANIEEINQDYSTFDFPAIHIDDTWVIASPEENFENKKQINFISQGAFGTGLHETTQDILRVILTQLDLKDKEILDIGTGSGILSIASSIAGASKVVALDIRDVRDEVTLNASLNNLDNIDVLVGDALCNEVKINDTFHLIYINIGGEETKLFINFIKTHLKKGGYILVSGLVEWSFEEIKDYVEKFGFNLVNKYQSNEWITAIFK